MFGAETIGWCVLCAFLIPAMTIGAAVLPLALLAIRAFSLFWNLLTAVLVPADQAAEFRAIW